MKPSLQPNTVTFPTLPRLFVPDGTIQAIKWLGLLLMTGDHINKYLFNGTFDWLYSAGRLCLPIFVFVLAYNLARPGSLTKGAYGRTMARLGIFGSIASLPFIALGGLADGWWPLNILFTLLVLTATLFLVERGGIAALTGACLVFLCGGAVVEFWWPALALGVAVWSYCKRPSLIAAAAAIAALAALGYINGNQWALLALPLILLASALDLPVPRMRWVFYAFYPLHLAALWLIRIPMSQAGYLFF